MVRQLIRVFAVLTVAAVAAPTAEANSGKDFIAEAREFQRIVTCGGTAKVPADSAKIVARHCRSMKRHAKKYKNGWVRRAGNFLRKKRPAQLPTKVVYPFGGGDLVSSLTTYPDATEITSMSLEHAGDPRMIGKVKGRKLRKVLALFEGIARRYVLVKDHKSTNLRKLEKGPIPGQLAFFLFALTVHDYEVVSLRFFKIKDDGSLYYYTAADVARLKDVKAGKLEKRWINTDYSIAFKNSELTFKNKSGRTIVHRHIAANLDNKHFDKSALQKHLVRKGKVAAMTKAASYLLWMNSFSAIRTYLTSNMTFMVSDSTGIPPHHAWRGGFSVVTYGKFEGIFHDQWKYLNDRIVKVWEKRRKRWLSFRYGYPDVNKNGHMMIFYPRKTRRSKTGKR